MTAETVQSYRAYYQDGRVFMPGNLPIPNGSKLIVTVVELPSAKSESERQLEAFERFMEVVANTPPLPPEFDEVISRRFNIAREVNL